MKLTISLWISASFIFIKETGRSMATQWDTIASSKNYKDTRLVMETENPFQPLNISKENSVATTRILCSKFCANNATCLGFNFYSTSTEYVCEFLPENFCSNRQRIALQNWPGGTVMDKLKPGMTKACIDQHFENSTTTDYCRIGRPGCHHSSNNSLTAWPGCDNCVKTCAAAHNCTLWPDGPTKSPIFAYCFGTATYLIKRQINMATGKIWPNYRMSLTDMHRVSRLKVYKTIGFYFAGMNGSYYTTYNNFSIDQNGFLSSEHFMRFILVPELNSDFSNTAMPRRRNQYVWKCKSCGCTERDGNSLARCNKRRKHSQIHRH